MKVSTTIRSLIDRHETQRASQRTTRRVNVFLLWNYNLVEFLLISFALYCGFCYRVRIHISRFGFMKVGRLFFPVHWKIESLFNSSVFVRCRDLFPKWRAKYSTLPLTLLWCACTLRTQLISYSVHLSLVFPSNWSTSISTRANTIILIWSLKRHKHKGEPKDQSISFFLCLRLCLCFRCNKWKRNTTQA